MKNDGINARPTLLCSVGAAGASGTSGATSAAGILYGGSVQGIGAALNANNAVTASQYAGQVQQAAATSDPNKDPAMSMELDALVDLFTVRYGTAWVDKVTKPQDAFWRTATARLEKCGRVETYHPWVRIIPNKTKEADGNS